MVEHVISPAHYTRRRLDVEAMRWDPDDHLTVGAFVGWLSAHGVDFQVGEGVTPGGATVLCLWLTTEAGRMGALPGDYIARSDSGFHRYESDDFEATFEPAFEPEVMQSTATEPEKTSGGVFVQFIDARGRTVTCTACGCGLPETVYDVVEEPDDG